LSKNVENEKSLTAAKALTSESKVSAIQLGRLKKVTELAEKSDLIKAKLEIWCQNDFACPEKKKL
jgi:hypothetical protein